MEAPDPGADEAAELVESGECWQHVVPHWSPDPRNEHNTTLPQGEQSRKPYTPRSWIIS